MKFDLAVWKNASSKRKRIYFILFIFIVSFVVTVIGAYVPLSHSAAQTISNQLNETLQTHRSNGTLPEYIFLNNFEICLLMFIPIIGPVLGLFILFDTGVALGALSSIQGFPVAINLIGLILTPVFWLEFTAYSTAMAESIWLFRRLLQRRWRELKNTAIFIGICAAILAVGAVVEAWLISLGI
jgi:uncharacterized membrane protein SpoIIM required for sporulation